MDINAYKKLILMYRNGFSAQLLQLIESAVLYGNVRVMIF